MSAHDIDAPDDDVASLLRAERARPGVSDAPRGAAQDQTPSRGVPAGVAPNELTATTDRDPFVGTPWHKHVPARLARL